MTIPRGPILAATVLLVACGSDAVISEPASQVTTEISLGFQPTIGLTAVELSQQVSEYPLFFDHRGDLGSVSGWHFGGEANGQMWAERDGVEAKWLSWSVSQGRSHAVTVGDHVVSSRFAVTSAFVDLDGRTWVSVNAKSHVDRRQHGWEVYDGSGTLLYSLQRPEGETLYDAAGDRVALLKRNPDDTYTIIVRRLTNGADGERVLW